VPMLKVDLQEGFSGETVVLLLDGKEIYRGTPTTRLQIGLADSRSFDPPPQHLTLEVTTPLSGVSQLREWPWPVPLLPNTSEWMFRLDPTL
jgi:hypothetical protein